jgi:hypothetical protein
MMLFEVKAKNDDEAVANVKIQLNSARLITGPSRDPEETNDMWVNIH